MTPPDLLQSIERLQMALGYTFSDRAILLEALTHRSYVNEAPDPLVRDNERLEFLGDAVIDLIVSTILMERFPSVREGALSRMRASLVNEAGLAKLARALDLGGFLRLGRGEQLSGGRERSSLLADGFEALIAAIYLDSGFDQAKKILLPLLTLPPLQEGQAGDPKTELQERVQAEVHQTPTYQMVSEEGPDHDKTFVVEMRLGDRTLSQGAGRTKKEAERQAAQLVLNALGTRSFEALLSSQETLGPEPSNDPHAEA